jgi:hypothetical protein
MTFVQVGHDDTLSLRYSAVGTNELPVFAHRIYLEERQLVLDE